MSSNSCFELYNAIHEEDLGRVRNLLNLGVDHSEVYIPVIWANGDTHLMTAMIMAPVTGNVMVEMIEELISHGANLDAANRNGYTALMLTTWYIQMVPNVCIDLAKLLIRSGCDVNISADGRTFIDMIPEEMRNEMVEYIALHANSPKPVKEKKDQAD